MSNDTTMENSYVLIMAGGIGSRFWPKSRNDFPKQFIDILGIGKSLLQLTYERFLKVSRPENIFFLSNENYVDIIKQQIGPQSHSQIISEPCRRNTAPCIAYAAFKIRALNPNANLVVAPSDHLILKEEFFVSSINSALIFASENEALLTLGIIPTRPDTGYGYIKYNAEAEENITRVEQFLEKPSLEVAKSFLYRGNYLWNAGIFVWNVNTLLSAFKLHVPDMYRLFATGIAHYNRNSEHSFILEHFPRCENISIDYAIMEKASNVYTLPGDFGWTDLGTWASLHEVMEKDEQSNSFTGKVEFLLDTKDCMIQIPNDKIAVIKGLSNYIIVDDGKVLLIYPKDLEQEVKSTSLLVQQKLGAEYE